MGGMYPLGVECLAAGDGFGAGRAIGGCKGDMREIHIRGWSARDAVPVTGGYGFPTGR